MSDGVSSIGMLLSSVDLMRTSQNQLQLLSQQNSTGLKSTSLAGYGSDAPTILDLQSSVTETQSWIDNSNQVGNYLTGYSQSLGQLSSDATQLQKALAAVSGATTAADSTTALQALRALVKGLEADVGATLNTQVGDRYIFAGSRYSSAPTVDLTQLPAPTTPAALTLAGGGTTPPTIPDYDTDYASTNPPGVVASGSTYYAQHQVNIASDETLSYGVSADDPAIQQLVYALKQAEAGMNSTTPATASQFLANAGSAVQSAVTGLDTLTQQNSANQTAITGAQAVQQQSLSTLQNQLGDLTQVDPATVATQLSAVENQLQGTYKATSTLLNLTILTYLT